MDGIVTHAAYKQDVPVKRAVCIASPYFEPVVSVYTLYGIRVIITIILPYCTTYIIDQLL